MVSKNHTSTLSSYRWILLHESYLHYRCIRISMTNWICCGSLGDTFVI
uniref:Uncharacterized protein n=1 Tax=Picea sitchensis TaxID=3332 RepID=D5ACJ9_PICSI|nr:unknown [Picea sitchensis]